jgi:extradiol dioxygenase family protein
MNPFHYAFKVKDIASTRQFYVDILGCTEGRSTENWIDFDLFGNQLSAHVSTHIPELDYCGKVDGVSVPIPHFGCILGYDEFDQIRERLVQHGITFVVQPHTRYEGQVGEQRTMFILDLSNNPIEFKAFKNPEEVFAS